MKIDNELKGNLLKLSYKYYPVVVAYLYDLST